MGSPAAGLDAKRVHDVFARAERVHRTQVRRDGDEIAVGGAGECVSVRDGGGAGPRSVEDVAVGAQAEGWDCVEGQ